MIYRRVFAQSSAVGERRIEHPRIKKVAAHRGSFASEPGTSWPRNLSYTRTWLAFTYNTQSGDAVCVGERYIEAGEFTHGSWSEPVAARLVPPRELPVKKTDARAGARRMCGGGGSGRAGAHDDEIERIVHKTP